MHVPLGCELLEQSIFAAVNLFRRQVSSRLWLCLYYGPHRSVCLLSCSGDNLLEHVCAVGLVCDCSSLYVHIWLCLRMEGWKGNICRVPYTWEGEERMCAINVTIHWGWTAEIWGNYTWENTVELQLQSSVFAVTIF